MTSLFRSALRGALLTVALHASLGLGASAQAFTSVAVAQGDVYRTIFAAWQEDTAAQADQAALDGCRKGARTNGVAQLASQCAVVERQSYPGFGAIVCGHSGCASAYGDTDAAARQGALQQCNALPGVTGCDPAASQAWVDMQVLPRKAGPSIAKAPQAPSPVSATSKQLPAKDYSNVWLLEYPPLQAGIKRAVHDAQVRANIKRTLSGPASRDTNANYELNATCEAHNCPHNATVIVNRRTSKLIICHADEDDQANALKPIWFFEDSEPLMDNTPDAGCPQKLKEFPKGLTLP
jgi:hypothetical protein